jgi:hypothetical protein
MSRDRARLQPCALHVSSTHADWAAGKLFVKKGLRTTAFEMKTMTKGIATVHIRRPDEGEVNSADSR